MSAIYADVRSHKYVAGHRRSLGRQDLPSWLAHVPRFGVVAADAGRAHGLRVERRASGGSVGERRLAIPEIRGTVSASLWYVTISHRSLIELIRDDIPPVFD